MLSLILFSKKRCFLQEEEEEDDETAMRGNVAFVYGILTSRDTECGIYKLTMVGV
jgi:hypothetical protein